MWLKNTRKTPVIVPLFGLSWYGPTLQHDQGDKVIQYDNSFELSDGYPDPLYLVLFRHDVDLRKSNDYSWYNTGIQTPLGKIVPNLDNDDQVRYNFRAGLVYYYYERNIPNQHLFFPHKIEQRSVKPLMLIRLFVPGDVFAPMTLVDEYKSFTFSAQYEEQQGHLFLHINEVKKFVDFYNHYWPILRVVEQEIRGSNSKVVQSWGKRINNASFFFQQSYFTKHSNTFNPDARTGNPIRLINLITALDALFGGDNGSSGTSLAKNVAVFFKDFCPNIVTRVKYFYELRSNYIHANPYKLVSHINNKDIEELRQYIQKAILINLELFNDPVIRMKLSKSNKKHYSAYFRTGGSREELLAAIKTVADQQDNYGFPGNIKWFLLRMDKGLIK